MNDDVGGLIEPSPVQFSWGAPGWYVLAALVVLLLITISLVIIHYYRKNNYRREALQWLAKREQSFLGQRPDLVVYDATMLMKRIVMARYGRDQASVLDTEWITFLNSTCKSTLFADQDAKWVTQTLYADGPNAAPADVQKYLNKTKTWIKRHRYAL